MHIHAFATGDMRGLLTQHPQIRTPRVKHNSVRSWWRPNINLPHELRLLDILQRDMPTGQHGRGGGREGSEGAEAGGDRSGLLCDVCDDIEQSTCYRHA